MIPEEITVDRDGHLLLIGINRPEKRNAVNLAAIAGLSAAYELLGDDPELRVGVLYGHGDHFSASDVVRLLRERRQIHLYAPTQAVAEMRQIATPDDEAIFERVTTFDLEYGDAPVFVRQDGLLIEALCIPHAGWPTARTNVQNITFRVTLEDTSTVLHLGDSDARLVHFEQDEAYWDERQVDLALPPYWFFVSEDGREILDDRVHARNSVGIHVPVQFSEDPSSMPGELLGEDLFNQPGEGRRFVGSQ